MFFTNIVKIGRRLASPGPLSCTTMFLRDSVQVEDRLKEHLNMRIFWTVPAYPILSPVTVVFFNLNKAP